MASLLKGAKVADAITDNVYDRATSLKNTGIEPTLAIVRVGNDPSDMAYERGAVKRAEKCGVDIFHVELPLTTTTDELLVKLSELDKDDNIHGILLFRPLPKHIDDEKVRNAISASKDVDGISDLSMSGVYGGNKNCFAPCTARACIEILKGYNISLKGKKAVVLGRSLVIGKPVAMLLLDENATVTICHSKSEDLHKILKEADIIISAVGKMDNLDETMVSAKQYIIDVGINVDEEGNLKGDVAFDKVEPIVEGITPVPGGVGSVTTSILMDHVVRAAEKRL